MPLSSKKTSTTRLHSATKTKKNPPSVKAKNEEPKRVLLKRAPYVRPHVARHSLLKKVSPASKKKYTPAKIKKISPKKPTLLNLNPNLKAIGARKLLTTARKLAATKPTGHRRLETSSKASGTVKLHTRRTTEVKNLGASKDGDLVVSKLPEISAKPVVKCEPPPVNTDRTVPPSLPRPDPYIEPDHSSDPQLCAEYAKDIYHSWLELERKPVYSIGEYFMGPTAKFIRPHHRCILVDWIFQVQPKFHLLNETMYLCVDILDRIIQAEPTMPKAKLQLAGVTALFIASKFEEIYPPSVSDFAYISSCYETTDILKKEMEVVKKLEYQFNQPYGITFLRRYSSLMSAASSVHNLAKYLLELSLLDHRCSSLLPSKLAAAALLLAAHIMKPTKPPSSFWNENMRYHTKYQPRDFQAAKLRLKAAVREGHSSPKTVAIRKKYTSSVLADASTNMALHRL